MAIRKPIVREKGHLTELPVGDTIEVTSSSAQRLEAGFIAAQLVTALRLVAISPSGLATLADKSDFSLSKVLGISLNTANTGETVNVLLFGKIEDAFFTYPANTVLYLSTVGSITSIVPSIGTLTRIGYSLGVGAIFIKIEEPIDLA